MAATDLDRIRALIANHKRWDTAFAVLGFLALMVGVLTFVAYFWRILSMARSRTSRCLCESRARNAPSASPGFEVSFSSAHSSNPSVVSR